MLSVSGWIMTMTYKLFLDDMRYPDNHPDWRLARNYHDAQWYVKTFGLPYHVAFDHDLADVHYGNPYYGHDDAFMDAPLAVVPYEFTGYDFAKWFCMYVIDNNLSLDGFTWSVHSQNPVGAKRIKDFMNAFMRDGYV